MVLRFFFQFRYPGKLTKCHDWYHRSCLFCDNETLASQFTGLCKVKSTTSDWKISLQGPVIRIHSIVMNLQQGMFEIFNRDPGIFFFEWWIQIFVGTALPPYEMHRVRTLFPLLLFSTVPFIQIAQGYFLAAGITVHLVTSVPVKYAEWYEKMDNSNPLNTDIIILSNKKQPNHMHIERDVLHTALYWTSCLFCFKILAAAKGMVAILQTMPSNYLSWMKIVF